MTDVVLLLRGTKDNVLDLPRTAGVTEFYVRTNAGNSVSFSFSSEELPNIISINEVYGSSYIDDEGWNVIKCKVIHKENHSTTEEIRGSINVRASLYGELKELSLLTIAQTEGRGNVVIGNWTGDYVEMAGVRWYPCNLGFDLDHPFGKYYQWGRKDGQYPYFEDNNVKFAESSFDAEGKITAVDANTYYYSNGNWFRNNNITVDFAWPTEDDTPYLGMGNPCPDGWRLPTRAEWTALNELFSKYSDLSLKDNLHGIASFEGKTTTGKAAVWETRDYSTGASLEFCISGDLSVQTMENFTNTETVNNNWMCRFGTESLNGYYWASDISSGYLYNYFTAFCTDDNCTELKSFSYQSNPYVYTSDGYSYQGYSVRCVQDIAAE